METVNYALQLIREEERTISGAAARINQIAALSPQIEHLTRPLQGLCKPSFISVWPESNCLTLHFWSLQTLQEINPILEAYDATGVVPLEAWETKMASTERILTYHGGEGKLSLIIKIQSADCKLVQVGTKTVTQPIYEVKCGGEDLTSGSTPAIMNNPSEVTNAPSDTQSNS